MTYQSQDYNTNSSIFVHMGPFEKVAALLSVQFLFEWCEHADFCCLHGGGLFLGPIFV